MCFVVVGLGELHGVCGHYRQIQARGQLHRSVDMGFVIDSPSALQLHIKTVRKNTGQLQRNFARTGGVTLHQGLPQGASLRAREGDQSFGEFLQPCEFDNAHRFDDVLRPSAADQFTQVQIALVVLHQQNHARSLRSVLCEAF